MTKLKVFVYRPPLVKLAAKTGGLTQSEAVQSANTNLKSVRERSLQSIEPSLDRMRILARGAGDHLSLEVSTELARLSDGVLGVAGAFDLVELSRAAYSLCELLEAFEETGEFNREALIVHVDALKLLSSFSLVEQQIHRETVLSNLYRVVERTRGVDAVANPSRSSSPPRSEAGEQRPSEMKSIS